VGEDITKREVNAMHPFEPATYLILFICFSLGTCAYLIYPLTRYDFWGIFGFLAFIAGFIFTTSNLVFRTITAGRPPFSNLYESILIFVWGIALFLIIFQASRKMYILGAVIAPVLIMLLLMSTRVDNQIRELMPALKSPWMVYHVSTAIVAYGAFTISFGFAVLYLLREYLERKGRQAAVLSLIPECQHLDRLIYQSIAVGFPFMALLIITGAIWADYAWGSYWRWDPKEVWALITALIYAVYLHLRLAMKWRGHIGAVVAVIGFVSVIICYLGVNLFFAGLHSYGSK